MVNPYSGLSHKLEPAQADHGREFEDQNQYQSHYGSSQKSASEKEQLGNAFSQKSDQYSNHNIPQSQTLGLRKPSSLNQKGETNFYADTQNLEANRLPKIENFGKNAKSEFDGYNPPMPARTRVLQTKNDLHPVRTHMPAPPIADSRKKGVKIDKTNSVKSGGFK